jgi:predicted nucleic acid-binding Zn ribbon protein
MKEHELYLYECEDCDLVFGVETAFEHQSEIVCPLCQTDAAIKDLGCFMATMTREPDAEV